MLPIVAVPVLIVVKNCTLKLETIIAHGAMTIRKQNVKGGNCNPPTTPTAFFLREFSCWLFHPWVSIFRLRFPP